MVIDVLYFIPDIWYLMLDILIMIILRAGKRKRVGAWYLIFGWYLIFDAWYLIDIWYLIFAWYLFDCSTVILWLGIRKRVRAILDILLLISDAWYLVDIWYFVDCWFFILIGILWWLSTRLSTRKRVGRFLIYGSWYLMHDICLIFSWLLIFELVDCFIVDALY